MRQRTTYTKLFKSQIVQECLQPDVSIASVALRHGINANLVRKRIQLHRDRKPVSLPAFVPLKMEAAPVSSPLGMISIEIPIGPQTLTMSWPISDPEGCARFVRGLSQ